MALGIGYGLPFVAQHGTNPYKTQWAAAREGAKGAGATVEDENAGVGSCLVSRGQDVYTDGLPFTPSMLIVPQFYKEGNLYQDVPPFVAEDSTMRFTVSRNTTATRVNSSGLIASVASGVPRIDWLGQSCPALLVEPSAQNLAFNSQTWTSANNWRADVSGNITTVTGAITAPDGTMTANAISPTAVSGFHGFASLGVTFASGTNYTMSAFFKQGTGVGRFVQLTFTTAMNSGAGYANFDLQLGIVTASGGTGNVAARIDNYGDGWYRCIYTATCNLNAANALGFIGTLISTSGATRSASFSGVTGDVLYGWGAQLEVGSVATTYIPTTTAAVSRAADVISASGALVSGLIGQTEGTIYLEFQFNNVGNAGLISVESTNNQNRVLLANANTTCNVQVRAANSNVFTTGIGTLTVEQFYKVAIGYSSGNTKVYLNGSAVITNTWAFTFDAALSRISLGNYENNSNLVTNSRIRALALYTTRLSDSQLEQLTKP